MAEQRGNLVFADIYAQLAERKAESILLKGNGMLPCQRCVELAEELGIEYHDLVFILEFFGEKDCVHETIDLLPVKEAKKKAQDCAAWLRLPLKFSDWGWENCAMPEQYQ